MRAFILSLFLLSILRTEVRSCDLCGCASASGYIGILPQFYNNVVGLRYQFDQSVHPSSPLSMNGTSQVLKDRFHTTELWARFYPSIRWQVLAFMPYKFHERYETERITRIQGPGDARALTHYVWIDTGDSVNRAWRLNGMIGGGLQIPTGLYRQKDENKTTLPAAFQTGSGAYAFLLSTHFTVRYKKVGANFQAVQFFYSTNESDYRFGDQLILSATFFGWFKKKNVSVLPQVGMNARISQMDMKYDQLQTNTGGTLLQLNAGVDLYLNKWILQTGTMFPIYYAVNGTQPSLQSNWRIGLARMF